MKWIIIKKIVNKREEFRNSLKEKVFTGTEAQIEEEKINLCKTFNEEIFKKYKKSFEDFNSNNEEFFGALNKCFELSEKEGKFYKEYLIDYVSCEILSPKAFQYNLINLYKNLKENLNNNNLEIKEKTNE